MSNAPTIPLDATTIDFQSPADPGAATALQEAVSPRKAPAKRARKSVVQNDSVADDPAAAGYASGYYPFSPPEKRLTKEQWDQVYEHHVGALITNAQKISGYISGKFHIYVSPENLYRSEWLKVLKEHAKQNQLIEIEGDLAGIDRERVKRLLNQFDSLTEERGRLEQELKALTPTTREYRSLDRRRNNIDDTLLELDQRIQAVQDRVKDELARPKKSEGHGAFHHKQAIDQFIDALENNKPNLMGGSSS